MKEQELAALKAELRAKYPGHSFRMQKTVAGDLVVFRSPLMAERDDYVNKDARNEVSAANRQLTLQVTVHPERKVFTELLTKFAFLCETVSEASRELGGYNAEALSKDEVEQLVESEGLRDKYPEHSFSGLRKDDAIVVFRTPTMGERQGAIETRKKSAAASHKQLAYQTCVFPAKDAAAATFERYPFLCDKAAGAVLEVGGGEDLGDF
jgi:hypothetical protein